MTDPAWKDKAICGKLVDKSKIYSNWVEKLGAKTEILVIKLIILASTDNLTENITYFLP